MRPNAIRDLLVEKEVIFHDDVERILGKRQWKSRTDEIIEINKKEEAARGGKQLPDDPYRTDFADSDRKQLPSDKTDTSLKEPKVSEDDGDAGPPPPFTKE